MYIYIYIYICIHNLIEHYIYRVKEKDKNLGEGGKGGKERGESSQRVEQR